uniref:C-type lectin lectoxin-Thr1-like n=1 Tax=Styela clava TaxID=7725 RepID=UPI001939CE3A|nr:C-type lectin lectoxin-Thr1-like [Styela clava]
MATGDSNGNDIAETSKATTTKPFADMDKKKLLGIVLAVTILIIVIVVILIVTLRTGDSSGNDTSNTTTTTILTTKTTNAHSPPPPPPVPTTKGIGKDWHKFSTGSYKLFPTNVNYKAAKEGCRAVNARLVTEGIRNAATRRSIMDEMVLPAFNANKLGEGGGVWIGLDDLEVMNTWKWIDGIGSTIQNTPWAPGEPNNPLERCGMLHKNLKWLVNDQGCSHDMAYVCEIAKNE